MYVTPRTLLAIIRLAQSMAKLSFRPTVIQTDVDEAIKLMDFSIRSLRTLKADNASASERSKAKQAGAEIKNQDRMSLIVSAIRSLMEKLKVPGLKIGEIVKNLAKDSLHGLGRIDREELMGTLSYYKNLSILYIDEDENVVFL